MMKNTTVQDTIYLAACAANGRIPDKNRIEGMDLDAVYSLAKAHMIAALVDTALERAGYREAKFLKARAKALRKAMIFEDALREVLDRFEQARIWYMPLKGAVLKHYYPDYGLREMADLDILIDPSRGDDVKEIMEGLGFSTELFDKSIHDVYHKDPVLNFEIHRSLFGPSHEKRIYDYYRQAQDRLLGDGYRRHFSPEDLYLYMLSHEYKHYSGSGTGIRSLLDTYLYLKAESLDFDYIEAETDKLGIREFEAANRSLTLGLFGEGQLSEADQVMLEYMISSGVHGTTKHRISNTMRKKGWSTLQYMINRFLVPVSRKNEDYEGYAKAYPTFYKFKVLLPLLPFYRLIRSFFNGVFRTEAKALRRINKEKH